MLIKSTSVPKNPKMSGNVDLDIGQELMLLTLLWRRRRHRSELSKRKIWTKAWLLRRLKRGAFSNVIAEINAEDPEKFRQFHRVERAHFEDIVARISPLIYKEDTIMRPAIGGRERLSITLRFLATGETFRSLSFQYRVGERTVSGIVEETCQALFTKLKEDFLKTPSTREEWIEIATEFETKWNYPCCIGAIDGKHIAIQQPSGTGSEFFNFKHYFSVLFLAVADANYKFLYVDCGAAGDAVVYNESALKNALSNNLLDLPPAQKVGQSHICYHMVGDDAFALNASMMKPYPHRNLEQPKRIFNYRLSRARRVIENAFGIFANRFRVFHTPINLSPEKVTSLVLAACCLHNYMVENNRHTYLHGCDVEDVQNARLIAGSWRNDPLLTGLAPSIDRNPTINAKTQRQHLTNYFSSHEGSVPWQGAML